MLRRFAAVLTTITIAATALVTSLAANPGSAGATTTAPAVGAQYQGLWSTWTEADRIAVLDKLASAHVGWIRLDIGWISVEEAGPGLLSQWYLDRIDRVVAAAEARGIEVLATLWATPSWANGGKSRNVPPNDPADYARIAEVLANRYRGRIAAWEVWNEPNHSSFWSTKDPVSYTQLLRTAYPAFKRGDPDTTVVLGGPSLNDTTWLSAVYAAGARGSFDVMSTHPYPQPGDAPPDAPDTGIATLAHVAAVRTLMVANGDSHLPIWFTELGWSTHENTAATAGWARGVTAEQQADYVVRALRTIESTYPYVTNVFWYMARDRVTDDVHQANFGLLTLDLQEKPAFSALRSYLEAATTSSTAPTTSTTSTTSTTTTSTTAPAPTTTTSTTTTTAPAPEPSSTSNGNGRKTGYRVVSKDGAVQSFGLPAMGSASGLNQPIVGMDSTPSGDGYWLVASDGGIFTFGDARFFGSTGAMHLNRPIVGMASTPSGDGYWLVASDGGMFTFGDARFFGSTGDIVLNKPIVAMTPTASSQGYWMVGSDGGIFTFGDAAFRGSAGDRGLSAPVVGMETSPSGDGYWISVGDGTVLAFGDAPNLGSASGLRAAAMA